MIGRTNAIVGAGGSNFLTGTVTRNSSTGSMVLSGLSAPPKMAFFWASGRDSAKYYMSGVIVSDWDGVNYNYRKPMDYADVDSSNAGSATATYANGIFTVKLTMSRFKGYSWSYVLV